MHYIQKYIIELLVSVESARFSALRPPTTNTNLFTYHLNSLIKTGMVRKDEDGYTLDSAGLAYVDRFGTEKIAISIQPKIIIMLLIQNSEGDILLQRRTRQPYINTWTLPYGKLETHDSSIMVAAKRQASDRFGLVDQQMKHAGDCYIRVQSKDTIISTTLVHVFSFNCDDIKSSADSRWARPHKLGSLRLAPAVEEIVARGFFNDPFFFEEFAVEWQV
jgi:ADP-ribose pyrophosphatase YjhB (NUDIX family)